MASHHHCVLIVDDHEDTAEALRAVLALQGYDRTRIAANGAEALAMLRTPGYRPCVVLVDMLMPVMDGTRFLEEKRGDAALASIPVIAMSSFVDKEPPFPDTVALLSKPLDFEELFTVVSRHCKTTAGAPR